jgi:hypothetical protein
MTEQQSFTKHENRILPGYREKMNHLESVEDVRKFFHYTVRDLLDSILANKIVLEYNDIAFIPDKKPYYTIHAQLRKNPNFSEVWENSDLPRIIDHIALIAQQHYTHLENKQPGKTESKLREKPSDIHIKKGKRGGRFSMP